MTKLTHLDVFLRGDTLIYLENIRRGSRHDVQEIIPYLMIYKTKDIFYDKENVTKFYDFRTMCSNHVRSDR